MEVVDSETGTDGTYPHFPKNIQLSILETLKFFMTTLLLFSIGCREDSNICLTISSSPLIMALANFISGSCGKSVIFMETVDSFRWLGVSTMEREKKSILNLKVIL